MTRKKSFWGLLKEAVREFMGDPAFQLSAATAFYSIFSIGPLLVLVIGLAGLVFGEAHVQQEVGRQLASFVGQKSTQMIQSMMAAQEKGGSLLASILGGVALVFGSTGVFVQLQEALNTIWRVTPRPGNSFWIFARDRFLSLAMALCIGFLLLVSMALSTFVNAFARYIGAVISVPPWLVPTFNGLVSFLVIWLLFAIIFKVLPDVKIHWGEVWVGAAGTALLFTGGKYLLGLYLSHETSASAYGAGSAFVVILMYVYYSSLILLFGAEFTRVYARNHNARIEPSRYAVRVRSCNPPQPARRKTRRRRTPPRKSPSRKRTPHRTALGFSHNGHSRGRH